MSDPKVTAGKIDSAGLLSDPHVAMLCLAALIQRFGGEVVITQQDVDAVAFTRLMETLSMDGTLKLQLVHREAAA